MAYRHWYIGLHLQHNAFVSVALQKTRNGWALQRWWRRPLPGESAPQERVAQLQRWRRELPLSHSIALSVPAGQTLQKTLPVPSLPMNGAEAEHWVGAALAQQLEMAKEALCFDFAQNEGQTYTVTAARRQDVAQCLQSVQAAGLRVARVTPDACALQSYLPWLSDSALGLAWKASHHWLWATRDGWGSGDMPPHALLRCTSEACPEGHFDPWQALARRHPPFPDASDDFAIAIALALGGR